MSKNCFLFQSFMLTLDLTRKVYSFECHIKCLCLIFKFITYFHGNLISSNHSGHFMFLKIVNIEKCSALVKTFPLEFTKACSTNSF